MDSGAMVRRGGAVALIGAIVLLVEGVLTLTDRILGTLGEIALWVALALVAVGAVTLFLGLLQGAPAESDTAPADSALSES